MNLVVYLFGSRFEIFCMEIVFDLFCLNPLVCLVVCCQLLIEDG